MSNTTETTEGDPVTRLPQGKARLEHRVHEVCVEHNLHFPPRRFESNRGNLGVEVRKHHRPPV